MKRVSLHALILMACIDGYGQQKFTISGVISDGESGEALIGASDYHNSAIHYFTNSQFNLISIVLLKGF